MKKESLFIHVRKEGRVKKKKTTWSETELGNEHVRITRLSFFLSPPVLVLLSPSFVTWVMRLPDQYRRPQR